VGENGGRGGGIIHIMAETISFGGSIEAKGDNGQYNRNGGGSGGSVRIEGEDITLNTIYVDGGSLAAPGAPGRIAIYYASSFSGNFTPGYLLNTTIGILDTISNNDFETGLGDMISSSPSDPNLATSPDSAYWGYSGLELTIANNSNLFVQDDAPDGEKYYRARFYMNVDGLSLATNDQFNYFNALSSTNSAFKVQMQKITTGKQIRLEINIDGGGTIATSWYDLTSGWHAIEVQFQAAGTEGANDGTASLYLDGVLKQTLTGIDNDTLSVDSVRMGAVYGIDTGTRGTIYFDDFDSRHFSAIGLLPDPGSQNPIPTPEPGFTNAAYTYSDEKPHAVTSVDRGASTDTYTYDANGNMTCRVEAGQTYVQSYNVENRMSTVLLVSGTCADNGTLLAGWAFTYDGDGSRVKQVYTDGISTLTTYYYAGGTYEVRDDGTTGTVWKYYAFAGMTVAVNDGSGLKYLLTDHLGSIVAVTDASGALLSQQRYLPFGQVRTDAGTITQTDFGYTGQRDLDAQQNAYSLGLMDYKARFYDPYITHFSQPDSIVPDLYNPQSLNRYSYVNNNPLRYTDPTGYCIDEGDAPPNSPANRNICPKRKTLPTEPTTPGNNGGGGDLRILNEQPPNNNGPITTAILALPLNAHFWNITAIFLDGMAWALDTYSVGVVTYGGIVGAGIPAALLPQGIPEVPVVTGFAGVAIAELSVQIPLRTASLLALASSASTFVADTKAGNTRIEEGIIGSSVVNSLSFSIVGLFDQEAYTSWMLQSASVANDFGLISFPFPRARSQP
jgi:RHS repeat-associated protein